MTNANSKGMGQLVQDLFKANSDLWAQEDLARLDDNDVVANAKRNVDKLNQKRNDLIEKIDDFVISNIQKGNV